MSSIDATHRSSSSSDNLMYLRRSDPELAWLQVKRDAKEANQKEVSVSWTC
jgi:hypothetical protein